MNVFSNVMTGAIYYVYATQDISHTCCTHTQRQLAHWWLCALSVTLSEEHQSYSMHLSHSHAVSGSDFVWIFSLCCLRGHAGQLVGLF